MQRIDEIYNAKYKDNMCQTMILTVIMEATGHESLLHLVQTLLFLDYNGNHQKKVAKWMRREYY